MYESTLTLGQTLGEVHNSSSVAAYPRAGTPRSQVPLLAVVWMTAAVALMPTLGLLAFYWYRGRFSKAWMGVANAAAGDVMLLGSCRLLAESAHNEGAYLAVGAAIGVVFMSISQAHLHR